MQLPPVVTAPPVRLLARFLEEVKSQSENAVADNANLFIFIFGHGSMQDKVRFFSLPKSHNHILCLPYGRVLRLAQARELLHQI